MILIIIFQGCGDDRAAGEESTLSLLHAYLRLVQVSSCFAADYNQNSGCDIQDRQHGFRFRFSREARARTQPSPGWPALPRSSPRRTVWSCHRLQLQVQPEDKINRSWVYLCGDLTLPKQMNRSLDLQKVDLIGKLWLLIWGSNEVNIEISR